MMHNIFPKTKIKIQESTAAPQSCHPKPVARQANQSFMYFDLGYGVYGHRDPTTDSVLLFVTFVRSLVMPLFVLSVIFCVYFLGLANRNQDHIFFTLQSWITQAFTILMALVYKLNLTK